jgi:hypothetical protein
LAAKKKTQNSAKPQPPFREMMVMHRRFIETR